MRRLHHNLRLLIFLYICGTGISVIGQSDTGQRIRFIDYYFENGSPLLWKIEDDSLLKISLLPDYQRQTLNRQTDHWYFRIIAEKGTRVRMTIEKMLPDIYNGRQATDWWNYKMGIPCYFSYDNSNWEALKTKTVPGKKLYLDFVMKEESVYLARLPVYSITHLKNLLERISNRNDIKVFTIGKTLENRPLEIIQLGNPDAKFNIILRARAHSWEPGGNWVIEGFIDEFLRLNHNEKSKNICFYILPMANKDGVARGMTRFNTAGMDLNRKWDLAPDSLLCPENYCLDKFIADLISKGIRPSLIIDLHNDDKGDIHLAKRDKSDIEFQNNMQKFEKLMRQETSFSENVSYSWNGDGQSTVMSIENGLLHRYGLAAFVYELNANWITGQNKIPTANDWKETGKGLIRVLYQYFENN